MVSTILYWVSCVRFILWIIGTCLFYWVLIFLLVLLIINNAIFERGGLFSFNFSTLKRENVVKKICFFNEICLHVKHFSLYVLDRNDGKFCQCTQKWNDLKRKKQNQTSQISAHESPNLQLWLIYNDPLKSRVYFVDNWRSSVLTAKFVYICLTF